MAMLEGLMPGMGPNTGLYLPSADPTLPSSIAEEYGRQQAVEQTQSLARVAMLTGEIERSMNSIVSGLRAVAADFGVASPGSAAPTQSAPAPTPAARPVKITDAYHGGSMGGIGKRVQDRVQKTISERSPSYEMEENPETGQRVLREHFPNGTTGREIPEDSPEFTRVARNAAIVGKLGEYSAGGSGLAGSLGRVAAKAGPIGAVVGAAIVAGGKVGGYFEDQQAAATPYRSAFGEQGTGAFAAQERFGEWTAGLKGFGTIGRERGQAQYRAASELGLRGDRRDAAMDFSTEMYKKLGMETGQSMDVVRRTAENGNLSLKQFSEAMLEVSRSAVEAGKSSKEAVDQFLAAQSSIQANVTTGAASVTTAENISGMLDQMPRALATGLGAEGIAGMLNKTNIYSTAIATGQDPLAFENQIRIGGAAGAAAMEQTINQTGELILQEVGRICGMTPAQMRAIVREISPSGILTPEQQQQALAAMNNLSSAAVTAVIRRRNPAITDALALPYFFHLLSPAGEAGTPFDPTKMARTLDTLLGKGAGAAFTDAMSGKSLSTEESEIADRLGLTPMATPEPGMEGVTAGDPRVSGSGTAQYSAGSRAGAYQQLGQTGVNPAIQAYLDLVKQTGQANPVIEGLLNEEGQEDISGFIGGDASGAKFEVTVDGKAKQVSLEDLVKDPSLLDSATLVTEGGKGRKSISDIVGTVAASGRTTATAPAPTVGVEFTGEAKRFFTTTVTPEQRAGVPAGSSRDPSAYSYRGG